MHFNMKNCLKNNRYHTTKHSLYIWLSSCLAMELKWVFIDILKNIYFELIFWVFFNCLNIMVLKINFKNKKYYFNIILNKKKLL